MGLRERAETAGSTNGAPIPGIEAGTPVTAAMMTPVPDSGIDVDLNVPVHVAWSRVMGDVQFIAKSRMTETGARYSYRGIDDVMNTVGPVLRRHGVMVMPCGTRPEYITINTKSGSAMNYCRTIARFAVIGPRGDVLPVEGEAIGEGFDSGDKSGSKAGSVALRTFYVQALAIPTNQPAMDPEYGVQHEIAGPRRPTADEYAAMIHAPETSIAKLQQIKAELDGDPTLGHASVEGLDGQQIELGRLVRRVGAARLKAEQGE
jgi:hypothetical protein